MSVMKDNATEHLINHIKSGFAVGKIATVDTELDENSTNPVQNKAIAEAVADATSYKSGDEIYIGGVYPCDMGAIALSNPIVEFTVSIPVAKLLPKWSSVRTLQKAGTSNHFSIASYDGYVKVNNVEIHNINFEDVTVASVATSYDGGNLLQISFEMSGTSIESHNDVTIATEGNPAFGFADIRGFFTVR